MNNCDNCGRKVCNIDPKDPCPDNCGDWILKDTTKVEELQTEDYDYILAWYCCLGEEIGRAHV